LIEKKVPSLAKNIKKKKKKKESPRKVNSFVIPFIENKRVVCGQKIGQIQSNRIICECCDDTFSMSRFEEHSGSTKRRPWANITLLETGKSLKFYKDRTDSSPNSSVSPPLQNSNTSSPEPKQNKTSEQESDNEEEEDERNEPEDHSESSCSEEETERIREMEIIEKKIIEKKIQQMARKKKLREEQMLLESLSHETVKSPPYLSLGSGFLRSPPMDFNFSPQEKEKETLHHLPPDPLLSPKLQYEPDMDIYHIREKEITQTESPDPWVRSVL